MEIVTGVLPHAAAVALSPMPIAALILILLSNKARLNSISFLVGWVAALIINVGFFMIVFDKPIDATNHKSIITELSYLILGILLVILAVKQWFMRPKAGETPKMPKWMEAIVSLSPFKAFLIAFALATVNAKNTVVNIATGVYIGQNSESIHQAVIGLSVFVLIGSITILLPVIAFLLFGDRMKTELNNLKTWFIYHSASILFVLFLILGLNLISKAFGN